MTNVIEELSVLTNISPKILKKLTDIEVEIISDAIFNNMKEQKSLTKLDIGIGIISVFVDSTDNTIKFNFTPDAKLVEVIKENIKNNSAEKSSLQEDLEDKLVAKLLKTYKEIL